MNITVIEDDGGFLSLKDDWDRLAHDLLAINKFDWIYRWWMHFKEDNILKILVAEDGNKVVGIAPLYLENIRILKYFTIKNVCFLGDDISPYLDFLVQQDSNRESIFQILLNYILHKLSFDALVLHDINSHYPNFDLWQKYASIWNLKFTASYKCPKIRFSGYTSYEDYLKHLSRKQKDSLNLRRNRIKKHTATVEFVFTRDITEKDIETVGDINIKRQLFLYEKKEIQGRYSHFTDKRKFSFIKDYFCSGNMDLKMLAYMKCNKTVISYYLILLNNNTIAFWNTGFDANYGMYAPTKLLINEIVKYAFKNNYDYIDFGRGNDSYKLKWANDVSVNYNLVKRKSLKAKFVYLCKDLMPEFLTPKKFRLKDINASLASS